MKSLRSTMKMGLSFLDWPEISIRIKYERFYPLDLTRVLGTIPEMKSTHESEKIVL
jgi:hypothetical protein